VSVAGRYRIKAPFLIRFSAFPSLSRAPHRGGRLRLDASSHFSTTLDIAQRRIDSAIAAKLDQFLSLADYDWTPSKARPESQEADFLPEMAQWLSTMMESVLVTLPISTKMQAYKSAFKYMVDQLLVSG